MDSQKNVLSIDVGSGNFAVCAMVLPEIRLVRLENWRLGDSKANPASQLIDRLLEKFMSWQGWEEGTWTPDVVLIEQQMRGAHANLALAFAAYTYLKTRFPRACVKFVKPASKFKAFSKFVPIAEVAVPVEYAKRKRLAVKIADTILNDVLGTSLGTLCPDAKRDDLADAFLQSFCM